MDQKNSHSYQKKSASLQKLRGPTAVNFYALSRTLQIILFFGLHCTVVLNWAYDTFKHLPAIAMFFESMFSLKLRGNGIFLIFFLNFAIATVPRCQKPAFPK